MPPRIPLPLLLYLFLQFHPIHISHNDTALRFTPAWVKIVSRITPQGNIRRDISPNRRELLLRLLRLLPWPLLHHVRRSPSPAPSCIPAESLFWRRVKTAMDIVHHISKLLAMIRRLLATEICYIRWKEHAPFPKPETLNPKYATSGERSMQDKNQAPRCLSLSAER